MESPEQVAARHNSEERTQNEQHLGSDASAATHSCAPINDGVWSSIE